MITRRLQSVPVISRGRPVPPRAGTTPLFKVPTLDRSNMGLEELPAEVFERDYLTKLVVKRNKMKELPAALGNLTKLMVLDISYNLFTALPKEVVNLKELAHLLISGNRINTPEALPTAEQFAALTSLVHIHMDANRLDTLPEAILAAKELERISANRNMIQNLPPGLGSLASLSFLDFSENKLQSVPKELCQLQFLSELNLQKNAISSLPEEMENMVSLKKLDLSYNNLVALPRLPVSLEQLNASRNEITALPANLGELASLCKLNMLQNKLTELPTEFYTRHYLTHANLSLNQISELSAEIAQLELLESLHLAANKLSALPAEVGQLAALYELNVSFNQLISLPDLLALEQLTHLYAAYNQLAEVPSLEGLPLRELMLCGNPTLEGNLPESLWSLAGLSILYLSDVGLVEVPHKIGELENLERLDLCLNKLTTLPDEIAIPTLQRLALAHNQLKCEIPEDVDEMMNLLELDLSHNPLDSLAADILGRPKDRGCDIVLDGLPSECDLADLMTRKPYVLSKVYNMGYAEMIGKRPTMEDAFSIVGDFGEDMEFWGMYDGHAGRNAASFAAEHHPPVLKALLEEGDAASSSEGVLKAIDESYFKVNALLKEKLTDGDPSLKHAGSTAVAVLRVGKKLYVSNAGDSRAVLCRAGQALRISLDHKPTDPEEEDRIREQGGYVMVDSPGGSGRVNGGLAVSRSIGDFYMHPYVTEKPYLREVELTDEDEFLILACDGVWDEVWDDTAVECVRNVEDPTRASAKLRDLAYVLSSDDNISVIVIQFNKEPVAHH
mmetsp:Transcript_37125/g.93186  ORF Transcript_37125/g.93186 Transcript_37125/m.93186 type:complete len:788 (+) Transcript_37125:819-3182(+)